MADRFYTPQSLTPGEFVLDGPEAHHLAAVRRFAPGDRVTLFNGDGREYPATVVAVGRRSAVLAVQEPVAASRELGIELVVASALPKGDRGDFLVEKLTELGATRFVPLVTARSVVVPKGNAVEKFHRAVIEASKQCGRNVLMAVDPPARWGEFVRSALPAVRLVLHTDGGVPFPGAAGAGVAVAVGPEGGWTPEEVAEATAAGWTAATLGPRVLRVETAALATVAILGRPNGATQAPQQGRPVGATESFSP